MTRLFVAQPTDKNFKSMAYLPVPETCYFVNIFKFSILYVFTLYWIFMHIYYIINENGADVLRTRLFTLHQHDYFISTERLNPILLTMNIL